MANNQIKYQKVEKNNPVVWVCDWNGSSQGLGTIKNTSLSGAVIRQLGAGTFDLFKDDFVNYKAGVILCMNQGGMLNKFFTVASPSGVNLGAYRSISDSIVFKCVRMPGAFKDQKNILSSPYGYGEKLFLTVSIEDPDYFFLLSDVLFDCLPLFCSCYISPISKFYQRWLRRL